MAITTGLWQKGHEELLKLYIENFGNGCGEIAKAAANSASILAGKDKNNDTEAFESMLETIVGYCNGQLEVMKETIGIIADKQAKAEEEKGSQCGYADIVKAALNAIDPITWNAVDLVVGGEQPTEEDMAAITSSFKPLRDAMQDVIYKSKNSVEEMSEADAIYHNGIKEFHTAVTKVFSAAVEGLNSDKKSFAEVAEDAKAVINKVGSYASDTASEVSTKATESAKSISKGIKSMADEL